MTTIGQFLTRLAEDEGDLLSRYQIAPRDVMTEAGVSQTDQNLILGDNLKAVRRAIRREHPNAKIALIVHP